MKITIVTKDHSWHIEQLVKEASLMNIDHDVRDVSDVNVPLDSFGDVVLWRSGSVNRTYGRTTVLHLLHKSGRFVINSGVGKHPYITHKLFQQKMVSSQTDCHTIHTYTFTDKTALENAIHNNALQYPFILKPNLGSQGNGIKLIQSQKDIERDDIDYTGSIFQNYIKNDGDYRVLVLGGKPLGVIKRKAKKGSFLNNISQGGYCENVTDAHVRDAVTKIAVRIAALFDLAFCGIDIMYDESHNQYVFLELNTVPQWQGFQTATGINVAKEILLFAKSIALRNSSPVRDLVLHDYAPNMGNLNFEKRFHFASRMQLTEGHHIYMDVLQKCKERFVGITEAQTEAIFVSCIKNHKKYTKALIANDPRRSLFTKKYPLLGAYNVLLFKTLLAHTIYQDDVTELLLKSVSKDDLITLRDQLMSDTDAIKVLSTHAVNYFYLLKNVFPQDTALAVDPSFFLALAHANTSAAKNNIMNDIYLLTHCIIGESAFYSKKIGSHIDIYKKMIAQLEKIVHENYTHISLDGKLEFLVSAKICGMHTSLHKTILNEADSSLSDIGNFIVDKFNIKSVQCEKRSFFASEHRNVLYLIATGK